jgi:hypothetical protein
MRLVLVCLVLACMSTGVMRALDLGNAMRPNVKYALHRMTHPSQSHHSARVEQQSR